MDGKYLVISEITELELSSYPFLKSRHITEIESFLDDVVIIGMNDSIKQEGVRIGRMHKIKLPDAIIAGTAISMNLPLSSADKAFEKISDLNFLKNER